MKRKLICGTALTMALVAAMGTTAFAAGTPAASTPAVKAPAYCRFVDANNDGICDNGDQHCTKFVDADNNGICDTCENQKSHNNGTHKNGCALSGNHGGYCKTAAAANGNGNGSYGHHGSGRHGGRHH